ncbi:glycerophosphodiester phosphodiesterase [Ornithinibacillus gellani]|uniref:glycerophosphodiester phosphodiesterase n=1 Tax=Ornithinibacillus gellani TaxID=2293253 RepID=UPI000F4A9F30|nr:glycerophosphodiester phosphodiesterase [Ornithinibacillus gellani]TQS74484.1 glycerophosphodiester phosphodiesterase [Ornithinibacillus gellani]
MQTAIIAHRGASKHAPENTMPAFELAYQAGAEGIETDVQLTKDCIPVIIHDEQLRRTTNGKGLIKDYTISELKQLDAGSWFSAKYAGTTLLTLEEFLIWAKPKHLQLNIELKNNKIDYPHLEAIVVDMLEAYQLTGYTTISTFNQGSVKRLRQNHPQVEIAWLTSKRRNDLSSYALELGADALHIKYRLLNRKLITNCQRDQLKVRVYTVNTAKKLSLCFRRQCHGIFTDVPAKAIKLRQHLSH